MRLRLGGIGDALADRNFRIYTVGSITSWICFFVQLVAVSWTAWKLTHSTTWLAYLVGAVAERHGLELPMLAVVAICLTAWGWAYLHRGRISAAFETLLSRPSAT